MMKIKQLVGMGVNENEYVINGIHYQVSAKFCGNESTITEKLEKYISSDFAHLTINDNRNTIDTEYVCSTAGKED